MLDVRGWGFLTGSGALRLAGDVAIETQESIGRHMVDLINSDLQNSPS